MTHDQHAHYFLLFCLVASILVAFLIVLPFLTPLILAAVFAFLFQPVYQYFLRRVGKRRGIAAFLTTIIALLVVIVPLATLGTLVFREATAAYIAVTQDGGTDLQSFIRSSTDQLRVILPIPASFEFEISQYAEKALQVFVASLGSLFSGFAKILISAFVFLMALYFLLKDGAELRKYLVRLSPLDDADDERIVSRVSAAVSATVKGSLIIGLIQGCLTGIGFFIFGVPHAALWGGIASIAALIPGVGTALVIAPSIGYLFFIGSTVPAIGLMLWGVCAVGLIDNILSPRLVGRGMQLHPLGVFISVLGGLAFFGPLGFLLGPLALSVCLAFLSMYAALREKGTA